MHSRKNHYIVFTSSFVTTNPGAGSWASAVYDSYSKENKSLKRYSNFHVSTTPNFLDIESIIETAKTIKGGIDVTFVHNSRYLHNVITKWIFIWEETEFKTQQGKPISNYELIIKLSRLRKQRKLEFIFVDRKEKPIYTQMVNEQAKLYTFTHLEKISPAETVKRIANSP